MGVILGAEAQAPACLVTTSGVGKGIAPKQVLAFSSTKLLPCALTVDVVGSPQNLSTYGLTYSKCLYLNLRTALMSMMMTN